MKNKQRMSKGNKNRKKGNSRNKNRGNTPTAVDRIDKEILEQISVLLSIKPNIDDSTICKMYGISRNQADFIRKHPQKWDIVDKLTGKEVK